MAPGAHDDAVQSFPAAAPRRVILFRHPDAAVAQQHAHVLHGRAGFQQFNGERIAQTMRPACAYAGLGENQREAMAPTLGDRFAQAFADDGYSARARPCRQETVGRFRWLVRALYRSCSGSWTCHSIAYLRSLPTAAQSLLMAAKSWLAAGCNSCLGSSSTPIKSTVRAKPESRARRGRGGGDVLVAAAKCGTRLF